MIYRFNRISFSWDIILCISENNYLVSFGVFLNFLNVDWCKINSIKKIVHPNKECKIERFCVKIIYAWRKFKYLKTFFDGSIEIGTCIYPFQKNVHVVTLPLKIYNIFVQYTELFFFIILIHIISPRLYCRRKAFFLL